MSAWRTQGRFVLLRHELPPESPRASHWDWMFETGDTLATWATDALPIDTTDAVVAQQLPDHRIAYLTYEGPVNGERGSVTRVDEGTYELLRLASNQIQLRLHSRQWRGVCALQRDESTPDRWWLEWRPAPHEVPE